MAERLGNNSINARDQSQKPLQTKSKTNSLPTFTTPKQKNADNPRFIPRGIKLY